jgi:hypothetical protein
MMDFSIDWFINRCYLNLFFEKGVLSIVLYELEEAVNPDALLWCKE